MNTKTDRKIWFQLLADNELGCPKETPKAFEAFEIYLKLGTERTVKKTAKIGKKSISTYTEYSQRYKWTERAESYDQWKNDLALKNHEKTLQIEAESHQHEWIQKRSKLRDEEYKTGLKLVETGNKILDMIFNNPLNPVVIRKNVKNRYDVKPQNKKTLTGYDETTSIGNNLELIDKAVKGIEAGFRLCRNSIDLPVGSFNHTFGNLPTSAEDLMNLSDEERATRLKEYDEAEKELISILKSRGENVDDLMISTAEN